MLPGDCCSPRQPESQQAVQAGAAGAKGQVAEGRAPDNARLGVTTEPVGHTEQKAGSLHGEEVTVESGKFFQVGRKNLL